MRQELRETSIYNAIIEAVALGNTQMNEINQKTLIEKNKLSVYLKNLIDLRILQREFPVADGIKEQAKFTPKSQDSQIQYWLFSKSGFTDDLLRKAESDRSIQIVTIDQLVGL